MGRVEKSIASEGAARKRDVAAVRAQMARNYAFNKAARAKLEKALLARMKANAHKAHADLVVSMRHVQAQFARSAALANRRNNANIRRSKEFARRSACPAACHGCLEVPHECQDQADEQ